MTKINEATTEVNQGINQFEQTLRNMGINHKVRKDEAERAVSESLANSPLKSTGKGQRFSSMNKPVMATGLGGTLSRPNIMTATGGITLTSTGLKTKDKKTVTEQTRKERERRRRKMIVDQGKTHIEMEQQKKEEHIRDRMRRQAK